MGDYTKYYTLDNFLEWMGFPEAAREVKSLHDTIDHLNVILKERNVTMMKLMEDNEDLKRAMTKYV